MSQSAKDSTDLGQRHWFQRIGPGLITACVVIGPGSILTSSQVGAKSGYQMSWVVVVAVLFMTVFMTLGARLGVVASESPGDLVSNRAGRWLAVSIGLSVFFISAAFQFGNNLGVHSAFKVYAPGLKSFVSEAAFDYVIVAFNLLSIAFLFGFKNLYRAVERLMMTFVGLMLVSFALNLIIALIKNPRVGELLAGFVPGSTSIRNLAILCGAGVLLVALIALVQRVWAGRKGWSGKHVLTAFIVLATVCAGLVALLDFITVRYCPSLATTIRGSLSEMRTSVDLSVLGLVGTTFVITAAFFQTYLVRQKQWTVKELKDGLLDARVGSVIMALITLMIMSTAATVLQGKTLHGVGDVAVQLEPLFGKMGQLLFCLGLFSAAYSSFLVNSMIGGFILSDGLGLGSKPTDIWPRVFTVAVLLTGMGIALCVIKIGWNPVPAIVAAQAVTVIASPLVAGALWWLTSQKSIMGDLRNGPLLNVLAGIGFTLLLCIAAYTATVKIPQKVQSYRKSADPAPAKQTPCQTAQIPGAGRTRVIVAAGTLPPASLPQLGWHRMAQAATARWKSGTVTTRTTPPVKRSALRTARAKR